MPNVLVTGATGFIGGRLVERLMLEGGVHVRVLVRDLSRAVRVARFPVEIFHGDLTDAEVVRAAVEGCDVIYNCAHDTRSPRGQWRSGREGTAVVTDAVLAAQVPRLVHLSSMAVYGPTADGELNEDKPWRQTRDQYALAKRAGEQVILTAAAQRGLPAVVLQPAIVYGPYGKAWTAGRIEDLTTGAVPLIDGGFGYCNAVYVDDVVQAMLAAATSREALGNRYLISGAEPVTWKTFYAAFEAVLGHAGTVEMPRAQFRRLLRAQRRRARRRAVSMASTGARRWLREPEVVSGLRDLPSVERAVDVLGRTLPQPWWDRLKRGLRQSGAQTQSAGPVPGKVHIPGPALLALYASRTRVSIDKARQDLGYQPAFDFKAGMELTGAWLRWANLV